MKKNQIKEERGLTLVEIIVVLSILAVAMTVLGGKIFGAGQAAKAQLNQVKMQKLKDAIGQFQLRYNKLPSSLEALIKGDSGQGNAFIPVAQEDDLRDSWGRNFQFALENGGRTFKVTTLGADGVAGGSGADFDATITGP